MFFCIQPTLNRLFNNFRKLYWYWISSSWNMKWCGQIDPPEKLPAKKANLIKVKISLSVISLWTSISLFESEVLLFFEFINIVLILYYICIEFILSLYILILLVISFDWHKEYIICLISLSKFSDILPAFTYARTTGNLWNICLGFSIWFLFLEANDILPPSPIRYNH